MFDLCNFFTRGRAFNEQQEVKATEIKKNGNLVKQRRKKSDIASRYAFGRTD